MMSLRDCISFSRLVFCASLHLAALSAAVIAIRTCTNGSYYIDWVVVFFIMGPPVTQSFVPIRVVEHVRTSVYRAMWKWTESDLWVVQSIFTLGVYMFV